MEASSMVMMNLPSSSSFCFKKTMSSSMIPSTSMFGRNTLKMGGFYDKGQLEYYQSSIRIRCGGDKKKLKVEEKKKKKKKKKGVKLLKGLSKDLSMFYGMGFGLDSEYDQQNKLNHQDLADQLKFKMMSEAAELLHEQLKQVGAEDKELKKKIKMEEKKKRKSEQQSTMSVSRLESSSSESSGSESDNEMVVDLNRLKDNLHLPRASSVCSLDELPVIVPSIPTFQEDGDASSLPTTSAKMEETDTRRMEGAFSRVGIRVNQEKNRIGAELGGITGKKIEVCMGGKCKKSGAATLIEEFQRVVGFNDDISVSGCKCMGKCKEGPNVRVVNSPRSEAVAAAMEAATTKNPLCLGVGVEDVSLIVSNFLGDESHHNGVSGVHAAAV